MHDKYNKLLREISSCKQAVVAYSGGVDSSLLLRATIDALGAEKVVAITALSLLQTRSFRGELTNQYEKDFPEATPLIFEQLHPLSWADFVKNSSIRCYICKQKIYKALLQRGKCFFDSFALLDGTNYSDLAKDRPGLRAAEELGVKRPLAKSTFTKSEIRIQAKQMGLSSWNRPANSCLATRIATGEQISISHLQVVEQGEALLHSMGFLGCRVKLEANRITLQLRENDILPMMEAANREKALSFFAEIGFNTLLVDCHAREE